MPHESFRNAAGGRPEGRSATPSGSVRFGAIDSGHVRRIVRERDGTLFGRYFADAVAARWAKDCERDRIQLAALFHQVVRLGRSSNLGATIAAAWKRREQAPLKLAGEDEDFARQLLRPRPPVSGGSDAALARLPVLQSASSGIDPEDYAAQQSRRSRNLASLAVMAGR